MNEDDARLSDESRELEEKTRQHSLWKKEQLEESAKEADDRVLTACCGADHFKSKIETDKEAAEPEAQETGTPTGSGKAAAAGE